MAARKTTKPTTKKKPATRKVGRPSKYSQAIADALCAQLAQGKSLRTICGTGSKDDTADQKLMPSVVTVFSWLRSNEEFLKQYTRAKEEASDALTDEMLDIADDARNDWMSVWNPRSQDYDQVLDREHVERSKLRIETRKWLASKLKPKKYGDKLDVTSDGERINPYAGLTTEELRKLAKGSDD